MKTLLKRLAERKQSQPGLAGAHGDHLVYTDPSAAVARKDGAVTWFIVSTESEDRDGDIVRSRNWELETWKQHGAPWVYDHGDETTRPIGNALDPATGELLFRQENGRTLAGICWDDTHEWGKEIHSYVDADLLSTASIGFIPKSGKPRGAGRKRTGYDIDGLELLELTITPFPSNREAMKLAVERGECSPVILKSFKKALGTVADSSGGTMVAPAKEPDQKAKLDDCVGRKVKVLMDEGYPQDQALAIAYKHCGEKHAISVEKAKTKAVDPEIQDAEAVEPEENQNSAAAPVEPHGVVCSRNCLEHMQALLEYIDTHVLPAMEPDTAIKAHFEEKFRPVAEELMQELHGAATEIYPDHDFGDYEGPMEEGEEESPEKVKSEEEDAAEEEREEEPLGGQSVDYDSGEEEAEGTDDEEEKAAADRYVRHVQLDDLRKKNVRRKAAKLSRERLAVMRSGIEHMEKVAGHLEESSESEGFPEALGYMHKGFAVEHRKHAGLMRAAVEPGYGEDGMPEEHESGGSMEEKPADESVYNEYKSVDDEVWKTVAQRLDGLQGDLRHMTGRM